MRKPQAIRLGMTEWKPGAVRNGVHLNRRAGYPVTAGRIPRQRSQPDSNFANVHCRCPKAVWKLLQGKLTGSSSAQTAQAASRALVANREGIKMGAFCDVSFRPFAQPHVKKLAPAVNQSEPVHRRRIPPGSFFLHTGPCQGTPKYLLIHATVQLSKDTANANTYYARVGR